MTASPNNDNSSLGIYIQIPFCASKCTFCNFSSGVERTATFDRYTEMLLCELDGCADLTAAQGIPPQVFSLPVNSIYFGGGTPALLGQERLERLVCSLRRYFNWRKDTEFTLETTPGSADGNLLRAFREMGVNRLSIGAQTFVDQELRAVGRLHSADDTEQLIQEAHEAGFQNISLDLIAGLPHQTRESFQHSLEAVARLRPEHVSLYLFEVDEKSRLGREVVHGGHRYHAGAVPGEEFMAGAYESGCAFLAGAGYAQYEISNFALPGFESRHNRKYWRLSPYLGFGAGAHSFDGTRRWSNEISVPAYMTMLASGRSPISDFRSLTLEEQVEEFFFVGLRQVDGVEMALARERWGQGCLDPWVERIQHLRRDGWVVQRGGNIRLAPQAYLISNEIFQQFVSA